MFRSNFGMLKKFYTAAATSNKHIHFNRQVNFLWYPRMPRRT